MDTIAVIGIGPDSGKTTYLNYLIHQNRSKRICLTSLGFNRLFSLSAQEIEKPRVKLKKGTYFTSVPAFIKEIASFTEVVKRTEIRTNLGRIYIYRSLSDVQVRLCGPAETGDFEEILHYYSRLSPDQLLIDGAMGRKSSIELEHVDRVVMAAGAGEGRLGPLVEEVKAFDTLCSKSQVDFPEKRYFERINKEGWFVLNVRKEIERVEGNINPGFEEKIADQLNEKRVEFLYVSGALGKRLFDRLLIILKRWPGHVVLKNVFKCCFIDKNVEWRTIVPLPLLFLQPLKVSDIVINSYSTKGKHLDSEMMRKKFRRFFKKERVLDVAELLKKRELNG